MVVAAPDTPATLTPRWEPLHYHPEQQRLWDSPARFKVVPAGRRSGKTERAKRNLVRKALECRIPDGWFVASAPTHDQAKRIYWADLKAMFPKHTVARVLESSLTIRLKTGVEVSVLGLDKPQRIEGRALDGIVIDEYADMKAHVWGSHVRPALSTIGRHGWAWLIGVPEGRNHYCDLYREARAGDDPEWDGFTWTSAEVCDPREVESARRSLDEKTFNREYNASFEGYEGKAYYAFDPDVHAVERMVYDPTLPLLLGWDFNRNPGTATVSQHLEYPGANPDVDDIVLAVIGEVHIPEHSTTPAVCRRIAADWGRHQREVICYGDASGGAKGSAKVEGSDWDLIRKHLGPVFGARLKFKVPKANGPVRSRVNAVNSMFRTADGRIRLLVDPLGAPKTAEDFEKVVTLKGGAGDLDKDKTPEYSHLSDGLGYLVVREHPIKTEYAAGTTFR